MVVFEDITVGQLSLLRHYVAKGECVKVFDWDFKTTQKKFLKEFFQAGTLQRIYISTDSKAHGQAIDLAKQLETWVSQTCLCKSLTTLYKDSRVKALFQRGLTEEIFKFCYITVYLNEEAATKNDLRITLVSHHYNLWNKFLKQRLSVDGHITTRVRIIDNSGVNRRDQVLGLLYRMAAFIYCFTKLLAVCIGHLLWRPTVSLKKFDHAVFIGSRLEVERAGERGYDFLIDLKDFTLANTVFIDHSGLAEDLIDRESQKGRVIFRPRKELGFIALAQTKSDCSFMKPLWGCLFRNLFSPQLPSVMHKVFFWSIQRYCDWSLILQRIDFKNFIFTNQENIQMSAVNALLAVHGKETWNYACFLGGGYIMARNKDVDAVRHVVWSFLIYDHFVGYNTDVIDYYQRHHQLVKQYHAVGSIYGEMILKKKITKKTSMCIAVFDTSFIDDNDCPSSLDDGIRFYEDMWRLVEEERQMSFIFKPSKSPAFYCNPNLPAASPQKAAHMLDIWKRLKNHPRVTWPIDLAITAKSFLDFSFNNDIIAQADVVITYCMSSPTAEALSAKKKAFWYESGDKYRGTAYDGNNGFIAHGYEALKFKITSLIHMDEATYNNYLNRYVLGKIDHHLDGNGLSRFKTLLINQIT